MWIQSFSGLRVDPLDLKPDQVRIEDIAHALALKTRFTGHCREFYSVAQHCVLGSTLLPWSFRLAFLLHEVSEAYLPDIAAPIKHSVGWRDSAGNWLTWETLEKEHARVIFKALGLSSILPLLYTDEIREMDRSMLLAERDALHLAPPEDWGVPGEPAAVKITPWTHVSAEANFLNVYSTLRNV